MSYAKTVYIVATPIGNLEDISSRAIRVLQSVDFIAAEDTRHSKKLLDAFNIRGQLVSLHEHNERDKCQVLLDKVKEGKSLAVISDAGTPLISDPGIYLVRLAHSMGIKVVPIPGPCALIAALSASGLATNSFCFEGFLPAKAQARSKVLTELLYESRTLIFYEAPHRILETMAALTEIFKARQATIAREITKQFEQIVNGSLEDLVQQFKQETIPVKGEFVIIVEGAKSVNEEVDTEAMLKILLSEVSLKQAVSIAVKLTKQSKKVLYQQALMLAGKDGEA